MRQLSSLEFRQKLIDLGMTGALLPLPRAPFQFCPKAEGVGGLLRGSGQRELDTFNLN